MPNHYTNIVTAAVTGADEEAASKDALSGWACGLLERIMPTPAEVRHPNAGYMSEAQVRWCNTVRGTKWDVYDITNPVGLPGDSCAYMVTFCTAWSAPSKAAIDAAIADAATRGIRILSWTGLDPYDNTAESLYLRQRDEPTNQQKATS